LTRNIVPFKVSSIDHLKSQQEKSVIELNSYKSKGWAQEIYIKMVKRQNYFFNNKGINGNVQITILHKLIYIVYYKVYALLVCGKLMSHVETRFKKTCIIILTKLPEQLPGSSFYSSRNQV
jgi:hypothetical protein